MDKNAQERAVRGLVKAWVVEGINPAYHREMKRRLAGGWVTLHNAIIHLVKSRPDLVREFQRSKPE